MSDSDSTNLLPSDEPRRSSGPKTKLPPIISSTLKKLDDQVFKRPFEIGSVKFAPIDVPLARRLQTLAVFLWLFQSLIWIPLIIYGSLRSTTFIVFLITYLVYLHFFQTWHVRGGIKNDFFRRLPFWHFFRDYFPIHLIKSVELPADRPYLFGYHPHGIIGLGAMCNFATEATGFSTLFPGINLRLLTISSNFKLPFFSFIIGLLGVCDAGKESCDHILSQSKGNSIILVLGGAKESLDSRPGTYDLTLNERKGFVKIALRNGAALVPVFSFGENDVYDQVPNPRGSKLRQIQDTLLKRMGFALPLFSGRGMFTYNFGLLPHRKAIVSVVGRPIQLPKLEENEITSEVIQQYHQEYVKNLIEVFEFHKEKYGHPNAQLRIVA